MEHWVEYEILGIDLQGRLLSSIDSKKYYTNVEDFHSTIRKSGEPEGKTIGED